MDDVLKLEEVNLIILSGHLVRARINILKDISFNIKRGECVAYLGENGAGKTSTFRAIAGLIKINSGSISVNRHMLMLPEAPAFYKHVTCESLLRLTAREKVDRKSIISWAERLDFKSILNKKIGHCSKGQVQRLGLALVLMQRPDLIILDEPLSGLDPCGRRLVLNVIRECVGEGQTIIFSSHIIEDIEKICSRAIFIRHGRIISDIVVPDSRSRLFRKPTWLEAEFDMLNQRCKR